MKTGLVALVTLAFAFTALSTAAEDPFVGTWKMNAAKSEFIPGQEARSQTLKIEAQENGFEFVIDSVGADGKPKHAQFVRIFGKDYPDNSMPGITVKYIRVDSNTLITVRTKNGEEVGRSVDLVSRDGRTLTRTMSGNLDVVYEKQ